MKLPAIKSLTAYSSFGLRPLVTTLLFNNRVYGKTPPVGFTSTFPLLSPKQFNLILEKVVSIFNFSLGPLAITVGDV